MIEKIQHLLIGERKYTVFITVMISFLFLQATNAQGIKERLTRSVQTLQQSPRFRNAMLSLTVMDARDGRILFQKNSHIGMAPASCLKTVTAATAFYLLGKEYRYHTRLQYSGTIRKDTLYGDLIIRGGGDPTLGSWRYDDTHTDVVLKKWAAAIRSAGIGYVKGKIIGDASVFDTQLIPDGWVWQDIGNYFGAGSSGLSWRENQFDIYLRPGSREGDPVAFVRTDPPVKQLEFTNELSTGAAGSGDQTYVYSGPYAHHAYLRGTAPANDKSFSVSASVPDPALFCAQSLQDALRKNGIDVEQAPSTLRSLKENKMPFPTAAVTINEHASPPLDKIIYWFLHKSINLYGEHLLKTLAVSQGQTGNTQNGVKIVQDFWEKRGILPSALNVFDGSGLSPGDRITTHAMATILYHIQKEDWFSTYRDCLPVIHGITMKDGYISNVRSYAGYLETKEGVPVIFSFIINNFYGSATAVRLEMWRLLDQLKGR